MIRFVSIILYRFVLEISFEHLKPECGSTKEDEIPDWWYLLIGKIHYLHFALILWGISTIITIGISLVTTPMPKERIYRYPTSILSGE